MWLLVRGTKVQHRCECCGEVLVKSSRFTYQAFAAVLAIVLIMPFAKQALDLSLGFYLVVGIALIAIVALCLAAREGSIEPASDNRREELHRQ